MSEGVMNIEVSSDIVIKHTSSNNVRVKESDSLKKETPPQPFSLPWGIITNISGSVLPSNKVV